MPSKLLLRDFQAGHYYHLRHEAKVGLPLFGSDADYKSFILLLGYYLRFPDAAPLSWVSRLTPATVVAKQKAGSFATLPVTLHAFLLLPDHFHLILRENAGLPKPGISNLLRRLSVGYAMYYNKAYGLQGTIYRGKYKMIPVAQDSLWPLVDTLHHHPGVNDTYLSQPLHSSRPDYAGSPRSWVSPVPPTSSQIFPSRLLLEK